MLSDFVAQIKNWVAEGKASSWHCLFPTTEQGACLEELGLVRRVGCQFHWFNRGYQSFEDYLAIFSSRKRKNTRKERAAIVKMGIRCGRQRGDQLLNEDWQRFYYFYERTYTKRGHTPHLSLRFFQHIGRALGHQIMVDWAWCTGSDQPIAAALFFRDESTLYGRYWGCSKEVEGLHFEVCFYRGIEYAIEQGLQRFDPGAQGEHKISRGFEPVETHSFHWIGHDGFRAAVARFVQEEKFYVDRYRKMAVERLPFKSVC